MFWFEYSFTLQNVAEEWLHFKKSSLLCCKGSCQKYLRLIPVLKVYATTYCAVKVAQVNFVFVFKRSDAFTKTMEESSCNIFHLRLLVITLNFFGTSYPKWPDLILIHLNVQGRRSASDLCSHNCAYQCFVHTKRKQTRMRFFYLMSLSVNSYMENNATHLLLSHSHLLGPKDP